MKDGIIAKYLGFMIHFSDIKVSKFLQYCDHCEVVVVGDVCAVTKIPDKNYCWFGRVSC